MALLAVRIVLAFVFISHGWSKFQDMPGTIKFFGMLGLPAFLAYVIATVELLGGAAALIGNWTHWVGKLLAIDMLGAIYLVAYPKGGFSGSVSELSLFALALVLWGVGPGKYTFKWLTKGK